MENTLQTILKNTYTKSDFYTRIGVVQEALEHEVYRAEHTTVDTEKLAKHTAAYARKEGRIDAAPYIADWGDEALAEITKGNLYDNVRELKDAVEELPELVLYTPVLMDGGDMDTIGQWCRENVDSRVILRNDLDLDTIGGCAFVWQGTYWDLSFRYFMRRKREDVSELIRTYDVSG